MRVSAGEVKKASHKYDTLEQQVVEVRRIWLSCRMPQSLRKQHVNVSASLGIHCGHLMAWTCCTFDPFSVNHTFLPACLGCRATTSGCLKCARAKQPTWHDRGVNDDRGVDIPGPWLLAASAFSRSQACTGAVQSHCSVRMEVQQLAP